MAPDAELYLAEIKVVGQFEAALNWLLSKQVDIINISLSSMVTDPGVGTGDFINDVINNNNADVFYSVAAGNTGRTHYEGVFNGYGRPGNDEDGDVQNDTLDQWHNFTPDDDDISFRVIGNSTVTTAVELRWYDTYNPESDFYQANEDLDLYLAKHIDENNLTDNDVVKKSLQPQNGGQAHLARERLSWPTESNFFNFFDYHIFVKDVISFENPPVANNYTIEVATLPGGAIEWESDPGIHVWESSIATPGDNANVCTAAGYPASIANQSSANIKANINTLVSSRGPDNVTFNATHKPDIFSPMWVTTVSYGNKKFGGTSAAAPHVAGAAALVKSRFPSYTRQQIHDFLCNSSPGYNSADFLELPPPIITGINDGIAITSGPTVLYQHPLFPTPYVAVFIDEDDEGDGIPDGDHIVGNWNWQLLAYHDAGAQELSSKSTGSSWHTSVPDLSSFNKTWLYDANNRVRATVIVTATDNDGFTHNDFYGAGIDYIPTQPSLQSAVGTNEQVTLTFSESGGADGYTIYYDTDSDAPYDGTGADQGASPQTIYPAGSTNGTHTYTLTGLTNGTTYYFSVKAFNNIGETGYSNELSAVPDFLPPPTPENLATTVNSSGFIRLDWEENDTPATAALGFRVYRSPTSGSGFVEVADVAPTGFTDLNVSPNAAYYYKVQAYNDAGSSGDTPEVNHTAGLSGSLTGDIIWTSDGALLSGPVTLGAGHTLTIKAGCNVSIAPGQGVVLKIYGTLDVFGTLSNPVVFERDGSSGNWIGIRYKANSSGSVNWAHILHASKAIWVDIEDDITINDCIIAYFTNQGIYLNGSGATVQNCVIAAGDNASHGIYITGTSNPEIRNNTIDDVPVGIMRAAGAPGHAIIDGNDISGSSNAGIQILNAQASIFNNRIYDCNYGIRIQAGASPDIHDNNIYSNTTGVYLEQSEPSNLRFNNLGWNLGNSDEFNNVGIRINYLLSGNSFVNDDRNNFYDGGANTDVMNLTSTTLMAQQNYWNNQNFSGSVDAGSPLTAYNNDAGPGGAMGRPVVHEQELASILPKDLLLMQNFPNPFNPSTNIRFSLPNRATVSLAIYDSRGSLVRKLMDQQAFENGQGDVIWDGSNAAGVPVTSGVYYYQIEAQDLETNESYSRSQKLLLVK